MSIREQAKQELIRSNFGDEDTAVMIDILEMFFDQWDSGGAVAVASDVLARCIAGLPLSPLTGADDEWHDPMGDGKMLQNVRCSSVFKQDEGGKRGRGGWHPYDIDNESWDGQFPYQPSTRGVEMPIYEIG